MNARLFARWTSRLGCIGMVPVLVALDPLRAAEGEFACAQTSDRLTITFAGKPVAEYAFRDEKILRPYFANLHTPDGRQVTRSHPPVAGVDATDHDTMHPGLWLAFGDINGQDFWRNKGRIHHVQFLEPPRVAKGKLNFAAENRLQSTHGQTLGTQISRITLAALPRGFLLIWQADFLPAAEELVFGDQEEMGLGVRVATKITEKNGGIIAASTGAKTAQATWGKSFEWCDYSGDLGDRRVGVALMADPANFRPSWFHNRDYGLMVANPFGRKSMKQGDQSRVEVKPGEKLRLRFGVLLHATASDKGADLEAAYGNFLRELRP